MTTGVVLENRNARPQNLYSNPPRRILLPVCRILLIPPFRLRAERVEMAPSNANDAVTHFPLRAGARDRRNATEKRAGDDDARVSLRDAQFGRILLARARYFSRWISPSVHLIPICAALPSFFFFFFSMPHTVVFPFNPELYSRPPGIKRERYTPRELLSSSQRSFLSFMPDHAAASFSFVPNDAEINLTRARTHSVRCFPHLLSLFVKCQLLH